MTTPLELSLRQDGDGAAVLSAAGEVDMSNAASFRDALGKAAAAGAEFTVDLTGVDYLDSAGLTALLPYAARIRSDDTTRLPGKNDSRPMSHDALANGYVGFFSSAIRSRT